ncbi:phosphatase PAP2 family protein [Marinicellulosiphila megalodicopiae]|uniref:phosphatase PAP2 family protein n=1 Tax=Marinicellulosiphila megalodicopiae TaxID=2724896 RepID=UPI003BAF2B79
MKSLEILQSINSTHYNAKWTLSTWLYWLIVPVMLIISVLFVFLLNADEITRAGYWGMQIDFFIKMNEVLSFLPDSLWLNMTYLGDGAVIFALFSFLIIVRTQIWAAMFGSAVCAGLMSYFGKKVLHIPRPAGVLDVELFNVIGRTLKGYNSLPSGHSITISVTAIAILATLYAHPSLLKHKLILGVGLLITLVFCLSRVAVGAHWPLDIISGLACGWIAALTGVTLARKYPRWWQSMLEGKRLYISAVILLLWALGLIVRAFDEIAAAPVLMVSAFMALCVSCVLFNKSIKG